VDKGTNRGSKRIDTFLKISIINRYRINGVKMESAKIKKSPVMSHTKTDEGLKRVIGVPGFSLNIINNTIGAGIFALPAIVSIALGGFAIFGYLFCGIMMAAIMLCYAEIGSRVTSSGGSYAYVEAAFGSLAGFIINWLFFLDVAF
jgi:amino acid transporter